jgi:hypothetical protein
MLPKNVVTTALGVGIGVGASAALGEGCGEVRGRAEALGCGGAAHAARRIRVRIGASRVFIVMPSTVSHLYSDERRVAVVSFIASSSRRFRRRAAIMGDLPARERFGAFAASEGS